MTVTTKSRSQTPSGLAGNPATEELAVAIRSPRSAQEWAQATALLHDYVEWLRAAVGVEPLEEQPALRIELCDLASVYDGVKAELFLAFDGPMAIGMVAIRHHDDRRSELKRMYLRPVVRGRGLADRLVGHVLTVAAARRRTAVWLETMRGVMEPALSVYRRNGFDASADSERTIALDGIVVLEHKVFFAPTPGPCLD